MEGLDLSALTDDQLVELYRLVITEVSQRDPAVRAAAQAALLTETERVNIRRAAAEAEAARLREAERQRIELQAKAEVRAAAGVTAAPAAPNISWERKKTLSIMVVEALGTGWSATVWQSDTKEQRVYFDCGQKKIAVYITGGKLPPGAIRCNGVDPDKPLVKIIAKYAATYWRSMSALDCDAAAIADCDAAPFPDDYPRRSK